MRPSYPELLSSIASLSDDQSIYIELSENRVCGLRERPRPRSLVDALVLAVSTVAGGAIVLGPQLVWSVDLSFARTPLVVLIAADRPARGIPAPCARGHPCVCGCESVVGVVGGRPRAGADRPAGVVRCRRQAWRDRRVAGRRGGRVRVPRDVARERRPRVAAQTPARPLSRPGRGRTVGEAALRTAAPAGWIPARWSRTQTPTITSLDDHYRERKV